MSRSPHFDELLNAARASKGRAYAPYSGYAVGAAILASDGNIYSGCNVENVSYGITICAERSALSAMVGAGCQEMVEVVVITRDGGTPCGVCRQAMMEFAKHVAGELPVTCVDEQGNGETYTLAQLLPFAFGKEDK